MNLEEAKRIIREESAGLPAWMLASMVLSLPENQGCTTFDDLLQCLSRGGNCAGNAAVALYRRTNRPGSDSVSTFSTDFEDWLSYLRQHRFI